MSQRYVQDFQYHLRRFDVSQFKAFIADTMMRQQSIYFSPLYMSFIIEVIISREFI